MQVEKPQSSVRGINGLRRGKAVKENQIGLKRLGKVVEAGNEYQLFFPVIAEVENGQTFLDIVAAGDTGRAGDYDRLGVGFIKINEVEETEGGKVIDKSGLRDYETLASLIYKAEMKREMDAVIKEADETAKSLGIPRDENTVKEKLEEIRIAYEGVEKSKTTEAKMPTKRKLINGLEVKLATEAVVFKLDKDKNILPATGTVVQFDLTNKKMNKLIDILDSDAYNNRAADLGFLEVRYSYMGKDKQEADRNQDLIGVEAGSSKLSKDSPLWKEVEQVMNRVSRDSEGVRARNSTFNFASTPNDFKEAFHKYMAKNLIVTAFIDYDSEEVKRSASALLGFTDVFKEGSKYYDKLKAIVAEEKSGAEEQEDIKAEMDVAGSVAIKDAKGKIEDGNVTLSGDDEVADI